MEGYRRLSRQLRTGKLVFLGTPDLCQSPANDEGSRPILPLAMGWGCKEVPHQEWISCTVTASLAKIIAQHWYTTTKQTESARLNAKMAGELFAIHHADDYTQEGMLTARQTIVDILKEYFINNRGIVKDAIITIAQKVGGISSGQERNKCIPNVNKGVKVNAQRHTMFASFGTAIPCTIMKDPVWQDFWFKCINNKDVQHPVSKPTQDFEFADNYPDRISAMSEEEIVGFFEAVVRTRPDQLRQYALASVFICIAALCQAAYATDKWVEERLKHLEKKDLNLNIKEHITAEIIDTYDDLYPREKLTNAMVCQMIVVMHEYLEERDHLLMESMIQQAITANISPVSTLADVAAKWRTLKWNIALQNGILTGELEPLAYLCMSFIRNPISFVKPSSCPIRYCADWSYVGMQLQRKLEGVERLFCNYRITVELLTEQRSTLNALCTEIIQGQEAIVDLAQRFAAMKVGTIHSDANWVYVTPQEQSRVLDLPGKEGQLVQPSTYKWEWHTLYDFHKAGKPIAKEDIRATWPEELRKLPKYAYRVPISKVEPHLQEVPVALKEVLCRLHDTNRRTMLIDRYIKDGVTNATFQFQRTLSDETRKQLETLGVSPEHIPPKEPEVVHRAYCRRQVFISPANVGKH